jgi:hypothetical protein
MPRTGRYGTAKLPSQTVDTTVREAVTMLRRLNHVTRFELVESLLGIPLDFVLLPKYLSFKFIAVRVISDPVIAILHWVASELPLKKASQSTKTRRQTSTGARGARPPALQDN